jgi:hypothetical protein
MPCVGFEPTIPASERAKTVHALGRPHTNCVKTSIKTMRQKRQKLTSASWHRPVCGGFHNLIPFNCAPFFASCWRHRVLTVRAAAHQLRQEKHQDMRQKRQKLTSASWLRPVCGGFHNLIRFNCAPFFASCWRHRVLTVRAAAHQLHQDKHQDMRQKRQKLTSASWLRPVCGGFHNLRPFNCAPFFASCRRHRVLTVTCLDACRCAAYLRPLGYRDRRRIRQDVKTYMKIVGKWN